MDGTPEWSDFRILLALSRGGLVAGAARELGVDASTVSRRLTALEESLGTRLLVRGGREFSWTAEGRAALACAEAMEAAVSDVIRECRQSKLEAAGAVRVSVPPGFLPMVFARMMPALREKQPSLKLDLSGDMRRVDLRSEADLAIRMSRPSEPDLVARRVFETGWCLYTSVAYSGTRCKPSSLAELARHHLVLYDEALHDAEPLRWLEAHRGPDFLRVDNLELASQLVATGSGIGLLPAIFEETVLHGVVISNQAEQWAAAGLGGGDNLIGLKPLHGWPELWERLVADGLLTLPDEREVSEPPGVLDGWGYVVEVNRGGEYRRYSWTVPETRSEPEARAISRMVALLRNELVAEWTL